MSVFRQTLFLSLLLVLTAPLWGQGTTTRPASPKQAAWTPPLVFERNEGQLPRQIAFLGRTQQYTVAAGAEGLRFRLPGSGEQSSVMLAFPGGEADAPVGVEDAVFRTNSYVGADVSKYRTGIRNYTRIRLPHLYPGVDAEFYAVGHEMEHDFIVAPGADATAIAMRLSGGNRAVLNERGEVLVRAEQGELRLKKPVAYQTAADGRRIVVTADFVLSSADAEAQVLRFRLGAYDHARKLVIDPVIVYATFAAGTAGSSASAIATDAANNVYVAGTTASTTFAPSPSPAMNCGVAPCAGNVFLAQLASGSNGSALQWITYIGTEVSGSFTTVTSLATNGTALYLGGSTNDTGIASGPASSALNATGGYVGYVSGLTASTGALNTTALLYLDATANNSSVQALTLDGTGNLYATGALGTTLPGTPLLLRPTGNAFSVVPIATPYTATAQPQPGNAFVAEFPAAGPFADPVTSIATPSFFSYVQTATQINGIAVDGGGLIYVGGQTTGGFSLVEGAGPATNTAGLNDAFELTFTVNAGATPPAVDAFTWIDGSGSDTVSGIALAGSQTSYLFGNTTSTDLPATTGVVQPIAPDTVGNGFVALAGATGTAGIAPVALTYLGGSGTIDTVTGGAFANGAVYVTGQTNAPPATNTTAPATTALAGVMTTAPSATAPFNTQALAYGMDTTGGTVTRGYLASLSGSLTSVNYVANAGGPGGSDILVGVALDSSQNAYVAGTIGLGSTPYTSSTAYQPVSPSTSAPSAYVAEIAFAPITAGLTLQPATSGSPSVNPVGYASASSYSSVTYTWVLTAPTATNPANLVVQIPSVTQLAYTSASITDTTNPSAPAIPCTVTASGVYCVVGTLPQTGGVNDTLNLVLNATVPASAAAMTGTFQVTATVSGPASDYASSSQSNTLSAPSVLTISPATTFAAATVFSTDHAATGPGTQATYAFTVANTGLGESSATSFGLTLPNFFHIGTVTATGTGGGLPATCDTSAATGCSLVDLPAGAALLYTVTGTYLDAAVSSSGSASAAPAFAATANGFLSSANATVSPNTTIERGVHLQVAGTLSALPTGQTAFNLGDPITYSLTVTNTGPSATSGSDPLTVTLPTGFVVSGGSGFTCAIPYSTCTVAVPVLASGGVTSYTVAGTFADNAANATVQAAAQTKTFAAAVPLPLVSSFDSGGAATDYATSTNTTIQRTALLTITASSLTAPGTVCAGGSTACVYMVNGADAQDRVPYRFTIQNAGPNTAVNARVTITLPFTPANPTGTPHPLNPGSPTVAAAAPSFGTQLTCTYAAGTNQIVCSGGNLPVTTAALTVTGNATIDVGAVPATTAYVTTAVAPGSVAVLEDANGAPAPAALLPIEVDRAAHLVTAKLVAPSGTTPSLPVNLDENAPSVAAGVNDTVTVTVQVGNTPLNNAPGVVVTEILPAYFRVTVSPPAAANCTTGTPAVVVAVNFRTQATPVPMTCSIGTVNAGNATVSSAGTGASVGSSFQSFSYSGKFQDNGINVDITGTLQAKVKQLTVALPVAVAATTVAVDPLASDATSSSPSVGVVRAIHLVLRKTRNTSVAAAPATFVDTTDPNLDEKTTATPFGVNDEVEYDLALGNAGPNTALGVQFTETLPPFFTLVRSYLIAGSALLPDSGANAVPTGQLPASSLVCYAGAVPGSSPITLPYATGASGLTITCTYGTAANPLSLASGPSRIGAPDNGTAIEFVYQGKFQDNAPLADNILAGVSTHAILSAPGEASAATSLSVDTGLSGDGRSVALPTYSIQRAAHLAIVGTPLQVKPDETSLTLGGAGGTGVIAQAELSSIAGTTPVYNCLRYKVMIQNSGPNVARQPQLTLSPPAGLNLTSSPNAVTATASTDAPLPSSCSYGASIGPVVTGATTVPISQRAGNTLVVDVDAYFGLNTLTAGNSQTGFAVSYTGLSDAGVMDSAKSTPFATITGSSVTVVNTPAGANFLVTPFSTSGARPARLSFGTMTTPGITTEAVTSTGSAVPTGASPDPRDNRKSMPLYRTGTSAPSFYSFATTAVPAAGSNPTGICVTSGTVSATLADGFAKPERVLLWALAGLPAGTTLKTVPNVVAPYAGDITTSVTAAGGLSYVEAGGPALPYTLASSFPAAQSQPGQVCGQVNGFAPAATPLTVAVLEPVNFAPLITANTQPVAQAPGKGVSEVSFLFPQTIHDYNDSDPCYVAGSTSGAATRSVCDDNLVLTTWIFGAESLIPSLTHVVGPLAPPAAQAFLSASTAYEVQAGRTLFLQVADQLAVPVFNAAKNCDPGNAPGSYSPVTAVPPCPLNTATLAGTPPQEAVFGSAEIALLTPSVNGGSSSLIALPPAADASSVTTGVQSGYVPATAILSAGQTVGFQWDLVSVIPAAGGTYNLACFLVDNATQNTATALPAGLSCQIPASITYPVNATTATAPANPAIYVVTAGATTARNIFPAWQTPLGGIVAALLLPLALSRRSRGQVGRLLTLLLLFVVAAAAVGCGSGFDSKTSSQGLAPGTYTFRASATPVKGGTLLTTAPFQVKVVAGN